MPKLPLQPAKIIATWQEAAGRAETILSLVLAGEPRLVAEAQHQLGGGAVVPGVWAGEVTDLLRAGLSPSEMALIFVGPEAEFRVVETLGYAPAGVRVILAVDEGEQATGRTARPLSNCLRVSFSDTPGGWRRLFAACVELAEEEAVALGRRYPVLRRPAARRVIWRTARENGLIGAAFFVPGSDWPPMTLNQVRMVLDLAALFGHPVDLERALEVLGVIALSLGFRRLGQKAATGRRDLKWMAKGLTGSVATVALGLAAIKYYEHGAPLSTSRVVAGLGSLRG